MTSSTKAKPTHLFLPKTEDLLRLLDDWCRSAGVSRSELARVIDVDRAAVTQFFSGRRTLRYEEAQEILEHLLRRLSPLPDDTISSLSIRPRQLVDVQVSETVGHVVAKLMEGGFTQIPVFDGKDFVGLATDRMIVERLLHPNVKEFKGKWIEVLRKMSVKQAKIIETSATYPMNASISSVATALEHFYAVMLSDNDNGTPKTIVTRWDYLKLLT